MLASHDEDIAARFVAKIVSANFRGPKSKLGCPGLALALKENAKDYLLSFP